MISRKGLPGLTAQIKDKLIQQSLERRLQRAADSTPAAHRAQAPVGTIDIPEAHYRFHLHPGYQQIRIINDGAARLGIGSPFFKVHEGVADATTRIDGREYLNFSSYNYLGLSGDADINAAAKDAIDRYGTSVSASRLVSGERAIHRELEAEIAQTYGVEAAIVLVSGHATNVTVIGHLFSRRDLILHDEFVHNSALQGMLLSGARRLSFPHNDLAALEALLIEHRGNFERVLIVVEGIYSMDGDYPDLARLIALKQAHKTFLMVDEAHSFGVMGASGLGIREHFGVAGRDVDIWMGTLSKSLAGCGGYIAGERALIEHLKFLVPGFLYSVGMSAPLAAASLAALRKLKAEPQRITTLHARGQRFLARAKEAGVDTGTSVGLSVIPAVIGSSIRAARLSAWLFDRGINVMPILYPAVPEKSARLRFFISASHSEAQVDRAVETLAAGLAAL